MKANSPQAIIERVSQLARSGQLYLALTEAETAIQRGVNAAPLYYLASEIADTLAQLDSALAYASRAIQLEANNASYHAKLGELLAKNQQTEDAEKHLQQSLELKPGQPEALNILGLLASQRQDYDKAEAYWIESIEADPNGTAALCNWANILEKTARGDEAATLLQPVAEQLPQDITVQMSLAVAANYAESLTPAEVKDCHLQFAEAVMAKVPPNLPPVYSRFSEVLTGKRRLRIGYFSPDMRDHSVASFLLPLIENHDKQRIEVFAYYLSRRIDAISDRFIDVVEHWRHVFSLPDSQLVPTVRADALDILIDCGGLFEGCRPFALAQRMAPIQAHYLGYPNTLGLPTVDFRIVDHITDPPGSEPYAVESLLRLNGCFLCYRSHHQAPFPYRDPDRPLTFGNFNVLSKLNPLVIKTWAAILRQVPAAKLLMKSKALGDSHTCDRLRDAFIDLGIDGDRIEFRGFIPDSSEHLLTYADCDIALDTFPYNGTTTTCQALWMGVPVVTLRGNTHPGRVGASLLTAIDHQDWIAEDLQDYIKKATTLTFDRAKLEKIQQNLRKSVEESPLTNAHSFTQKFEASLFSLLERR